MEFADSKLNPRFPSPLRYPGGKGKIANFMRLLLLENGLTGIEYVEPYAGGASVGLSLLFEGYVDHISVNDADPAIHAFWRVVLNDTEQFCERVRSVDISIGEWERQREIQSNPGEAEEFELGFSTFFLNRTNRSGIIAGGVIGGRNQAGKWPIDARFNRTDLINRIRKVERFRSRISLSCEDAVEFLEPWASSDAPWALLYMDPPYVAKGGILYRNYYTSDDHDAVAAVVRRLQVPWVVSYDNHELIRKLYSGYECRTYSLNYSAAAPTQGSELMFFAPDIKVTSTASPASVSNVAVARAVTAKR